MYRIFVNCFISSFQEWAYTMARRPSSVCLSVCLSVNFCANRFCQANGRIATKLSQDGLQVSVHPGCAQGQRSRDTGTFVLARKSLLLPGKWPDCDQTCTRWSPGKPASRMCSRSKVTWYGHFCAGTKIASSPRQMAGSRPNLHRMVSRWTCIQGVLKVKFKVKGHVIRAVHFRVGTKIVSSRRKMTRSPPNLHPMVTR